MAMNDQGIGSARQDFFLPKRTNDPMPPLNEVAVDRGLIEQSVAGDQDAYAQLYLRHRDAILATCIRRLRDRTLAEDAMQDTFVRAYASLAAFDATRPLLPWLQSIAARRCIDLARRSSRMASAVDIEDHVFDEADEDPTLRAVLAADERRQLEEALRKVAPRQRRALLLHAIEGWSYADIAAAEDISVASTKSLLFHARRNLRRACKRGALAAFALIAYARRRGGTAASRIRVRSRNVATASVEVAGTSFGQTVAAITVAIAALTPQLAPVATGSVAASVAVPTAQTARIEASGVRNRAAVLKPGTRSGSIGQLIHPTRNATPEQSQMTSIAASPDYENDHTLVASGRVPCASTVCPVLFISRDGGATWQQRNATGFTGYEVLLPPDFPRDRRIFAMAPEGLEVSKDLGGSFKVALPVQGEAAISPLFDDGDARLLVANASVIEYWADSGLTKPAVMIGPAGRWLTVEFSSTYRHDRTVFVGGIRAVSGAVRAAVYRCTGDICGATDLTGSTDAPWVRVSPRFSHDHVAYAFTPHELYRSTDGGSTFVQRSIHVDPAVDSIRDVLVGDKGAVLMAIQSTTPGRGGIYRSTDGGTTWTRIAIGLSGFRHGAEAFERAPGGRLFALGASRGLLCSDDGGRTWLSTPVAR